MKKSTPKKHWVRRSVNTFTDRYPLVGPAVWISSIQYFAVQLIAALAFTNHYSWRFNTISDLGNTACGPYGNRLVCSPDHGLMNASFVLLGVTIIAGSSLVYQEFKRNTGSLVGFSAMALSGLGSILVGLFPENTVGLLHLTGAELVFVIGNIALIVFSLALMLPKVMRIYTFLSGITALAALVLFTTRQYLSLGTGGMERFAAYPQTVWLIVFGLYISSNHMMRKHRKSPRTKPIAQ
jgi:hypothetical membrane protein